jgi:hypothetical protein
MGTVAVAKFIETDNVLPSLLPSITPLIRQERKKSGTSVNAAML